MFLITPTLLFPLFVMVCLHLQPERNQMTSPIFQANILMCVNGAFSLKVVINLLFWSGCCFDIPSQRLVEELQVPMAYYGLQHPVCRALNPGFL